MLQRLQSIRPRLQLLARLDPQFQLFGAGTHRYQLAPPLAEDEVATFELLHGVRLPEDYRAFLLDVGSWGAGPYGGLKALGNFEHAVELLTGVEVEPPDWCWGEGLDPNFLASPFPHRNAFNLMNPEERPDAQSSEEEQTAFWNLREEAVWKDNWVAGTICLSHEGCGMLDLLIVSGEERGAIWVDDRCNDGGLSPLEPNRTASESRSRSMFLRVDSARLAFLDWYEWWLDWSLQEAKAK